MARGEGAQGPWALGRSVQPHPHLDAEFPAQASATRGSASGTTGTTPRPRVFRPGQVSRRGWTPPPGGTRACSWPGWRRMPVSSSQVSMRSDPPAGSESRPRTGPAGSDGTSEWAGAAVVPPDSGFRSAASSGRSRKPPVSQKAHQPLGR